jgi:GDP-mannose 6-dehydrogenase
MGEYDRRSGDLASGLYAGISAPLIRTDVQTALLVKYFSNVFHALKIVFANEVGSVCRDLGVDGSRLMEIFCADTNLNISPKYLKPGFPFGGSCLPKDLRALLAESHRRQLHLPVLEAILPSNELRLKECTRMITESGRRKIGLVGLTFKAGTDDLRESPAVELAETLLGKGYELRIFDPQITPGMLHGSNLRFIETTIPHIWKLLARSLEELIENSDVVVLTQKLPPSYDKDFGLFRRDQVCIDFVGAVDRNALPAGIYRSFTSADNQTTELLVVDAVSTSIGGD